MIILVWILIILNPEYLKSRWTSISLAWLKNSIQEWTRKQERTKPCCWSPVYDQPQEQEVNTREERMLPYVGSKRIVLMQMSTTGHPTGYTVLMLKSQQPRWRWLEKAAMSIGISKRHPTHTTTTWRRYQPDTQQMVRRCKLWNTPRSTKSHWWHNDYGKRKRADLFKQTEVKYKKFYRSQIGWSQWHHVSAYVDQIFSQSTRI